MRYDQQLHPYIVDSYGRTDETPPTLTERLGGRDAAMAAMRAKLHEEGRPERERKALEAREALKVEKEAEAHRVKEIIGRVYPEGHVVYYLRFCCRVKIGMTTNLAKRLYGIPHDELLATEPGQLELEAVRHKQFNANRIKGEWFDMTPKLFRHLLSLRDGQPWTHMPDSWIRGTRPST